jgi:hypothetical protein
MNFSKAIALILDGKAIYRKSWKDNKFYVFVDSSRKKECLFSDGYDDYLTWTPTQDDIFAEDWEENERSS